MRRAATLGEGGHRDHLEPMTVARAIVVLIVLSVAAPATAQVPGRVGAGWSAFDQHRQAADRHRRDMDRLRIEADERDIQARQQQLETRLNSLRIQSARRPDLIAPAPTPALRSPEEERAAREAASARRQASATATSQIDAWLDRPPR